MHSHLEDRSQILHRVLLSDPEPVEEDQADIHRTTREEGRLKGVDQSKGVCCNPLHHLVDR